ncbi:response regulator transcription factor [Hydrogenimonas sp.]
MLKLLLVEDDLTLGETLADLLKSEGFEVVWVKDGEKALDATFVGEFDLFLLDVKVPFVDGFELLRGLRESGDETPAIFITALTDIHSLSEGFESGADDYIKKPFDFDELLVRIRALIKKRYQAMGESVVYGDIRYDIDRDRLTRGGEPLHLPPFEKRLLRLLLQNIGKVVTKEEIAQRVAEEEELSEQALRVHINKLRKAGFSITNLRGIGYMLEERS